MPLALPVPGPWWQAVFVGLVICGLAGAARADTIVIQSDRDNTIYDEGALSNGAGQHVFAGLTNDATRRRALLRFDVAGAVPAGSTIDAVTLTLYLSRSKNSSVDVHLHVLTRDWGEESSAAAGEEGGGAAAQAGDATWAYASYDTVAWTTAGGDFVGTASALTTVGKTFQDYTWTSAQMIADVQAWLDSPSSNHGWIAIGEEVDNMTAKRFDSRENAIPGQRPRLTIDFTPPGTAGACCPGDGSCTVTAGSGGCTGAYQGDGTSCTPNPCPQPAGACCTPDETAACTESDEGTCTAGGGVFQGSGSSCGSVGCPVVLTPYLDALPLPAVAEPVTGVPSAAAAYVIAMREGYQQLHASLPPTRVWGYDDGNGMTYPGPTIEARTDEPVQVTWRNDLRDADTNLLRTTHALPVDNCLHGAESDAARVVVHLHGGHVAAAFDGYPEATLAPGQEAVYDYPNWQQAAAIWYHDHALGITRLNVQMGLAGLYVVRDSVEDALDLPDGAYEVPLVVQDRTFAPDGSFVYPGSWQGHFFGDTALVNGKVWPYLEVTAGKYRFRILNGSNSRTYHFMLSSGESFVQIGSDGGLLPAPVSRSSILLAPGERADVIVDFSAHAPGTEIVLQNDAPSPYPTGTHHVIPEIMKFVVIAGGAWTDPIPGALRTLETLDPIDSVLDRDLELSRQSDPCGGTKWLIDGLDWDTVTEMPQLGTTEVWRFINRTGVSHPMHMHLVFFQVLDRQQFEVVDDAIQPIGVPVPADPWEAGWKDTVGVNPDEIVRVIARFEDFVGKYPYHCHTLEHEDHEMMRQFQTFTTCGDGARGIPGEACDDGNGVEGDGCDTNCTISACGNDIAAGAEECDGLDFASGDSACTTFDPILYTGGTLGCTGSCTIDTTGCTPADIVSCWSDEDGDGQTGTEQAIYETQLCASFDTDGRAWTDSDGGDCNDDPLDACAAAEKSGGTEVCDGCDDDCDGFVDDDDADIASGNPAATGANTYYSDGDGDDCGDSGATGHFCASAPPDGWIDNTLDVDDTDGSCCGNDRQEASEACDGADFAIGSDACTDLDAIRWIAGTLACVGDCTIDTAGCTPSGNKPCWSDEDGDGQSGTPRSILDTEDCGAFTTDGRAWTETDGGDCNDDALDACAAAEKVGGTEVCNGCDDECNGFIDDGSGTCCGNGALDADETCDDGNTTPADGCEPDCTLTPRVDAGTGDDAGIDDAGTDAATGAGGDAGTARDAAAGGAQDAGGDAGEVLPPIAGMGGSMQPGVDGGVDAGHGAAGEGGCSCRAAGPRGSPLPALLPFLVLGALVRRRRLRVRTHVAQRALRAAHDTPADAVGRALSPQHRRDRRLRRREDVRRRSRSGGTRRSGR